MLYEDWMPAEQKRFYDPSDRLKGNVGDRKLPICTPSVPNSCKPSNTATIQQSPSVPIALVEACSVGLLSSAIGLLLVLDARRLELLGCVCNCVFLLRQLSFSVSVTVDTRILLCRLLRVILSALVGVRFSLETINFLLGFGDVLMENIMSMGSPWVFESEA